jgi:hypothetical protein
MVSTDVTKLLQASTFAAEKHKFQKRKDPEGTPYINHPLGVALLLAEAGVNDIDALMAAILHDTVEVFYERIPHHDHFYRTLRLILKNLQKSLDLWYPQLLKSVPMTRIFPRLSGKDCKQKLLLINHFKPNL